MTFPLIVGAGYGLAEEDIGPDDDRFGGRYVGCGERVGY